MLEQMINNINQNEQKKSEILLLDLGRTDYDYALELQDKLVSLKLNGFSSDFLIITEHNPVITLGKLATEDMLKLPIEDYNRLGIEIRRVGRGGWATYHGPGQIVGYPILDLEAKYEKIVREDSPSEILKRLALYKEQMCNALLETIRNYEPFNEHNTKNKKGGNLGGIWYIDDEGKEWKIGARGIEIVENRITKHGFALDVTTPSFFHLIKPCGHEKDIARSMHDFVRERLEYDTVKNQLILNFGKILNYEIRKTTLDEI